MTKKFPYWKKYLSGAIIGALVVTTVGFGLFYSGSYGQGFIKFKQKLTPNNSITKMTPQIKVKPAMFR